tara:strand:+ start:1301 stop:1669 length:369 start_codon:yes stop_codon:yes gene_type:complete
MAHYAFLDKNNIVTEVIVGKDEGKGTDWEIEYGNFRGQACKRTSYNTSANAHSDSGTAFRGNYAGIGYTYDETNDVFIAPKPYDSWVLDETKWIWKAPVDMPDDNKYYDWNEDTTSWDLRDE